MKGSLASGCSLQRMFSTMLNQSIRQIPTNIKYDMLSNLQPFLNLQIFRMKNFNNNNKDELQKYQKMGNQALKKIKSKIPFSLGVKKFGLTATVSLVGYLLYRVYDHWSYRKNNYIDIFQVKRAAIKQTRRMDFWHKITHGLEDHSYANEIFVENFSKGFERIQRDIQSMQSTGDDVQIKEIILTEYKVPKINLGFLQLHLRESYMVISKKGDLVKKSYDIPVKLLGVPFGSKKKQATKKTVRKMRQSKMVETTTRLELPLACKPINFLNTFMKQKQEQRKLLFECRQKMESVEKNFIDKIKQAVDYIPPYLEEGGQSAFSIPKI